MNGSARYFFLAMIVTNVMQGQAFHKTRMVDAKGKEVPVELDFDSGSQQVNVKTLKVAIAEVPYAKIDKLSYEMAARHRVKEGAIVMIASLGVGGIVMLTQSKSHWLYVDFKDKDDKPANLTLKLDKTEYEKVLAFQMNARTLCRCQPVAFSVEPSALARGFASSHPAWRWSNLSRYSKDLSIETPSKNLSMLPYDNGVST